MENKEKGFYTDLQRRRVFDYVSLAWLKPQSHYSDNQSPTSDNHFFGWLPEVVTGRQMFVDDRWPVGNWLSENFVDNLSPTSDNHFFFGWFSEVFGGRQIGCQNSLVGERYSLQH